MKEATSVPMIEPVPPNTDVPPRKTDDSSVSMMEASDAAAWVKGQYLAVDGGYTIR
jgi:hypothetical protein